MVWNSAAPLALMLVRPHFPMNEAGVGELSEKLICTQGVPFLSCDEMVMQILHYLAMKVSCLHTKKP